MSIPRSMSPDPGERGRVTTSPQALAAATVNAWDLFLAAVADVDLHDRGRKDSRTAARTLVVLGSWSEGRPLAQLRDDALAGRLTAEHLDEIEARVVAAHADDPPAQIRSALARSRDDIAAWADSPGCDREALLPVGGPLGVVPLGTLVAAQAYQCAVAALDLAPAGVVAPDGLVCAGLASLIDTVGAVAAQQSTPPDQESRRITLTAITPFLTIGTGADSPSHDWRTTELTAEDAAVGPALIGEAATILDIASGRRFAPTVYARGEIRVRDIPGLMLVAKVLAEAPELPGTDGLRTALTAYTSTTQAASAVARRIGGLLRRRD